jgi:hypothetical protein
MMGGIGVVVLAVIVTLVMFATVIGHGGGRLVLTGTPRQIVLAAFSRTAASKTVHMQYTISVSGAPSFAGQKGKAVSVSMTAQGAFDFTNKSAALTATGPGPNGKGTEVVAMRIIGPTLYLSAPGLTRADGGKPWIHVGVAQYEQKEGQTGFSSFLSGDLSQSLGVLRQQLGKTTALGPATIDGVATIHYRVMLPVTATSSSGVSVPTSASWPADVWVNGQRQLSQLRLQIPFFGLEMSDTVTLSDYGSPVSVTPPPANQTANGAGLLQSGKLDQILGR